MNSLSLNVAKVAARAVLCEKRLGLSATFQAKAAEQAAHHFLKNDFFAQAKQIAVYCSHQGELTLEPLIKILWEKNKKCYLPVLSTEEPGYLFFTAYDINTKTILNRFGIPEPVDSQKNKIALMQLDIVLMPLVAFDQKGHRLGMGGGFYDRTFACRLNKNLKKPLLIGVGYAFQEIKNVPVDVWDVPLDGILTEEKYHCQVG